MIKLNDNISNDDFQSYLDTMNGLNKFDTIGLINKIRHDFTNYDDMWRSRRLSYRDCVLGFFDLMKSYRLTSVCNDSMNGFLRNKTR